MHVIRDVSFNCGALPSAISFNFYHFSRPRDAIRRRMPVSKGWKEGGEWKLESQIGKGPKGGKKEGKGEGKENKRVENSRIRVRETCLFHFGWKIYVYRIFLFKSIWKIFGEVLNLEIIIWSFFFFLIIYNFSFHLSTKFRIVWWNVPHVLHQCVLIYVYIVFLFFFFMFVLMFEHCPLIELHRNDLKYIK